MKTGPRRAAARDARGGDTAHNPQNRPRDAPLAAAMSEPTPTAPVDAAKSEPPAAPGLVLVVDDQEVNRRLAGLQLRMLGWTATECESGARALEMLEQSVPQAMLIDIRMPRLSGDELARRVRERFGDRIRLVGYTAHCLQEELDRFMQAGFDALLTKPASLEEMREKLPPPA